MKSEVWLSEIQGLNVVRKHTQKNRTNSMDEQSGESLEHYKALTKELEEKNEVLVATIKRKEKEKYEEIEKLRLERNEVCAMLNNRLEELAVFLDFLLKQKSVLGFLGNEENKRLRETVDQSLNLSRSFTASMLIDPEQLTNISSLLNDTKTKVDDDIDNQWESDCSVSSARIGLAEGRSFKSIKKTDSTEEQIPERSIISTSKKSFFNESRYSVIELHSQVCQLREELNNEEKTYHETVMDNNKLKQNLENLKIHLKDSEVRFTEAQNKKIEAEIGVENLQKQKDELLEHLIVKDEEPFLMFFCNNGHYL